MQSTKHFPFVRPLTNSNRKQAPRRDSKQADSSKFNKENVYPYCSEQVNIGDPYHADVTDSNKENAGKGLHPYLGVAVPFNPYDLLISPIRAGDDAVISLPDTKDSFYHSGNPPSSLDVYRQRELLNRPGKKPANLSLNTKQPALQNESSASPLTTQPPELLKRQRSDKNEDVLPIAKRLRSQSQAMDGGVLNTKNSPHQNNHPVSTPKRNLPDYCKTPINNWSKSRNTVSARCTKKKHPESVEFPAKNRVTPSRNTKRSRCLTSAKKKRPDCHYKNGSADSGFRPNALLSRSGGEHGYTLPLTASPTRIQRIKTALGYSPLKPILNEHGSPTKAIGRDGKIWNRQVKSLAINTYTEKAIEPQLCDFDIKKTLTGIEPTFAPRSQLDACIVLDNKLLDKFFGVRKGWSTTQGSVLGMRAADALRAAGVDVREVECHILHNIAFTMGGLDGKEPNAVENFTNGTAGSNGFHLRMEDAIKALVRKHGPLYVRYSFDPNQSLHEKKWHLGSFTYEFGTVKNPELITAFRNGKVGEDQVKGECVNSMVINPLDKRFSSVSDATYLYVAGDIGITRIAEKNQENAVKRKLVF